MTTDDDDLEPDQRHDTSELASRLRAALHDDEVADLDPGDRSAADPVPAIRRRAAQRRQRKVLGMAMTAVLVVLLGGGALALTRPGATTIDDQLAALGPSSSERARQSATVGASSGEDTASSSMSDAPPTTPAATNVECLPATTLVAGDQCAPAGTSSTAGSPGAAPCASTPTVSCATVPTSLVTSTAPPVTTIPPTSNRPTTTPSTGNANPIDCGSSTPSGYPTTTMAWPGLSKCLVDAFNRGQRATLRVVTYNPGPTERVERDYEVTGLRVVRVVSSTNAGAPTTPAPTTSTCHALADIYPDPNLVQASQCG